MIFIGNESLQSFIFRHIQIAGGTDFSCVVEDTGAWVSSPRIPEKYQHIFHLFDEELLLDITKNSGLAPEPDSIFSNPTSSIVALSKIFAGNNSETVSTSSIQIAYCERCIESSLVENGFAHFDSNWLFSSYCEEHNVRLSILKHSRRGVAISAIKKILTGDSATEINSLRKSFEKERYRGLSFNKKQKFESPVYFMPCTVKPLLRWLTDNIQTLKNNRSLEKRYWMRSLLESKFILPHDLEKICIELNTEEPNLFKKFVVDNFMKKKIGYGVWDDTKFSSQIYKVKGKSCSQCFESIGLGICPMSPEIQNIDSRTDDPLSNEILVENNILYTHKVEFGQCKLNIHLEI